MSTIWWLLVVVLAVLPIQALARLAVAAVPVVLGMGLDMPLHPRRMPLRSVLVVLAYMIALAIPARIVFLAALLLLEVAVAAQAALIPQQLAVLAAAVTILLVRLVRQGKAAAAELVQLLINILQVEVAELVVQAEMVCLH